jgi:phenol 2-monooxygenase
LPAKGCYGLRECEKIYWTDLSGDDAFDLRGVDRGQGRMVVVRPNQYVANVLPLLAFAELGACFVGFMLAR